MSDVKCSWCGITDSSGASKVVHLDTGECVDGMACARRSLAEADECDALKARVAELEAESAGRLAQLSASHLAAQAMAVEAVAEERERCLKAANAEEVRWRHKESTAVLESDRWQHRQQANVARDVAAAIRARGGK